MTLPYTYTPSKPPLPETVEQLKARIPGWGVDLDPAVRPNDPKLQWKDDLTGALSETTERQAERWPRERSIEHGQLTPVFGTSCPPKGLSGVMRKVAYRRYSEAQVGHWLLLLASDRVDAWESHLRSFATLHPDNPVTQTGVLSEFSASGSLRNGRSDRRHHLLDPVVVGGPWVAAAGVAYLGVRRLARRAAR